MIEIELVRIERGEIGDMVPEVVTMVKEIVKDSLETLANRRSMR